MGSVSSLVGNVLTSSTPALLTDLTAGALKAAQQNRSSRQAAEQLSAQQQQNLADATSKANLQRDMLVANKAQTAAERQNQLKAAVSKIRAKFSGQGIDPDSGSAAVLQQTQSNDVAAADAEDQQDLENNFNVINNQLSGIQQRNLLAQTQLRQRQQLRYWND